MPVRPESTSPSWTPGSVSTPSVAPLMGSSLLNATSKSDGYFKMKDDKQDHDVVPSHDTTAVQSARSSLDLEKHKLESHHPHDPHEKDPNQPVLPWSIRLRHFTWAWYTLTMSTGGIATLISVQPHKFPGLMSIGAAFYIFNLALFTAVSATLLLRFLRFPGSCKESVAHEREGLFLGPFFLSIATIILGTEKYVVEAYRADHPARGWVITSLALVFWTYLVLTFTLACWQYSYLFAVQTYPLHKFMPSWLLPIFPIMLVGTIAAVIAKEQPENVRMPIIVAGLGCQGLGVMIAMLMYAHYIGRLMSVGYPNREHRTAMFIGVGPPSFTAISFIGMANALPDNFDIRVDGALDAHLLRTMALVSGLFLWVFAMWLFVIALIAVLHSRPKYFHLGWWGMVFPNVGFIIATINIGNSVQSEAILYIANALTIALICLWAFVLYYNVRAVVIADIMYPGRDEDVED